MTILGCANRQTALSGTAHIAQKFQNWMNLQESAPRVTKMLKCDTTAKFMQVYIITALQDSREISRQLAMTLCGLLRTVRAAPERQRMSSTAKNRKSRQLAKISVGVNGKT